MGPQIAPMTQIADEDWAARDEGMAAKTLKKHKKESLQSISSAPLGVHAVKGRPLIADG